MSYFTKIKLVIFFALMVVFIFFFKSTSETLLAYTDASYQKNLELLQNSYKANINLFTTIADGFYTSLVDQEEILALLVEAKKSHDTEQKERLRQEVFSRLYPHFKSLKEKGLKIVLFTFEENEVFLRVHKPSKHGDYITQIRKMVVDANREKKVLRGFEQGKLSHAFRNVYPLFYKDEFIGSVDIAFSSESLQENIFNLHNIYTHFLVNKSLFASNIWTSSLYVNYLQSIEHSEYLYSKAPLKNLKQDNFYADLAHSLHEEIKAGMDTGKRFALCGEKDSAVYILAFEPILQYKDSKAGAYLVSYTQNVELYDAKKFHMLSNIALLIVLLLLALILFYLFSRKKSDKKEK